MLTVEQPNRSAAWAGATRMASWDSFMLTRIKEVYQIQIFTKAAGFRGHSTYAEQRNATNGMPRCADRNTLCILVVCGEVPYTRFIQMDLPVCSPIKRYAHCYALRNSEDEVYWQASGLG